MQLSNRTLVRESRDFLFESAALSTQFELVGSDEMRHDAALLSESRSPLAADEIKTGDFDSSRSGGFSTISDFFVNMLGKETFFKLNNSSSESSELHLNFLFEFFIFSSIAITYSIQNKTKCILNDWRLLKDKRINQLFFTRFGFVLNVNILLI